MRSVLWDVFVVVKLLLLLLLSYYYYYVMRACMEVKGRICGSILPFHLYIGPGDQTQVVRPGGKLLYPPSGLADPR